MTPSTLGVNKRTPRRIALTQKLGRWDVKFSPYLYVSPFFVLFALVGLFPLLYTGWVSLHDWDLIGGEGRWLSFLHISEPTRRGKVSYAVFCLKKKTR